MKLILWNLFKNSKRTVHNIERFLFYLLLDFKTLYWKIMLYKDKIISDPIFSVHLPEEALQKISQLFKVILRCWFVTVWCHAFVHIELNKTFDSIRLNLWIWNFYSIKEPLKILISLLKPNLGVFNTGKNWCVFFIVRGIMYHCTYTHWHYQDSKKST